MAAAILLIHDTARISRFPEGTFLLGNALITALSTGNIETVISLLD